MESPLRCPDDPGFRLIETGLWTLDTGLHHRDLHLARLTRTAARLGIVPDGVDAALDAIQADSPQRLRLTVDAAGRAEVTTAPFSPLPDGTVWRVQIAKTRLSSTDPWLGVKTTQRALYDTARVRLPEKADELIFLNERGEVCEGTITNIFADLGQGLVTPPLSSGCLPGILRQSLLERGEAREEVLTTYDLKSAGALYVGNALRGLIPAVGAL